MIASTDHPLARKKHIAKEKLSRERFLLREEGSGTRNVFEYYFSAPGTVRPKDTLEMGSDETIKQAVMAGLGLSLISAHTIAPDLAANRLAILKVADSPIMREWFIVRRSDRELPPAGKALWTFISRRGKAFLPNLKSS
jgi:DNA-binding transcriptional LysR family regulator